MPLLLLTGEWDELYDLATHTRTEGSPLEQQMAVTILGNLLRYRGQADQAWEMVREILPRGPASQPEDALFPYATETLRLATRLSLDAREPKRARVWLETHDQWLDWSGALRGRAESAALLSEILYLEGDLEEAERTAADAVASASEPCQPLALIAASRTLGTILVDQDKLSNAEAHLNYALQLASDACLPYETALSELAVGRLLQRYHRDQGDALRMLEAARTKAVTLQAIPLLEAINALFASLDASSEASKLTEREIEVLRMISQGLTDAEAAEKLYISPRTVSQHMRSVYNKLGVSSRAAATRWAVKNNLV